MRIVVLTSLEETNLYINRYYDEKDIVYPTNAYLFEILIKNRIQYITLSSFIEEGLHIIKKLESEELIKKVINDLNAYSNKLYVFNDQFEINIGDYYSFNLHVVLGQIHYIHFIIEQINLFYKPQSWLVFKPKLLFNNLYNGFRPGPVDVFQNVISAKKWLVVTVIQYYSWPNLSDFKILIKDNSPNILLKKYYNYKNKNRINGKNIDKMKNILAIDALYEWSHVINSAHFNRKYSIEYLFFNYESPSFVNNDEKIFEILNQGLTFNNYLIFDIKKQSKIITKSLYRFKNLKEYYCLYLNRFHCLLNTVFVKPEHNFLAHLANYLKIPVLTWQHGEMGSYIDIFQESIETRYSNIYFCYGDGVAERYSGLISKSALKEVVPVGNLSKKCLSYKSEYILYATGKWTGVVSPFFENFDTDSKLFITQVKIIEFLDNLVNVRSIFKASNQPNQNLVLFKCNLVEVNYNSPFTELVANASLIILDTPTTTLIEAVSTDKPIFVISGLMPGKWNNVRFIELLKKRALVFESADDLLRALDLFLNFNIYDADVNNREFYHHYASKLNNSEVINSIINKIDSLNK